MSVDTTGYIRVTHTGATVSRIYLKDIDGEYNRGSHQKLPVYVGPGNYIDILLTDLTLTSYTQGDIKTFVDLGYITAVITRDASIANTAATRFFHEPTITPADSQVQPGQGPIPIVYGSVMGLEYDQITDASYREFKIPSNYVGNPSFHIHWTKSTDAVEAGNTVTWRLQYTVFNGTSEDINVAPSVSTWTDTYEDGGTTTRIVHRTPNNSLTGFVVNYYVGVRLDYTAKTLTSNPVVISADLLWEGLINV